MTEAASGPYVSTPILAAMAGAEGVLALTQSTIYGTAQEIADFTVKIADLAGVRSRIDIVTRKSRSLVSKADIVTNSGHVRPIDQRMISWMKSTAVVPLMYEAWEFRRSDVDITACMEKGIAVAGTNETNPALDVFSYLGIMAVKLLLDAGVAVHSSSILTVCDNPFAGFIKRGLVNAGANVDVYATFADVPPDREYDAILLASRPKSEFSIGAVEARVIADNWPGAVLAQYWGDVDRQALEDVGVCVWPEETPAPGHMGILPSDLGPEPVVTLQVGGLKVGELLWRERLKNRTAEEAVSAAVQSGWGQEIESPLK